MKESPKPHRTYFDPKLKTKYQVTIEDSIFIVSTVKQKVCSCCKIKKSFEFFYNHVGHSDGKCSYCKVCDNLAHAAYAKLHPKETKGYADKYRKANQKKVNLTLQKWGWANPEKRKLWRKRNPEKAREITRISGRKRYKITKNKISGNMSNSIRRSLRGNKKNCHWESLVGYTAEQLKEHIEKQFLPGMSWENWSRNGWHIDHKIPQAAFNFEKSEDVDFKKCWELNNLQPLWAKDNKKKQDTVLFPFQPSFSLGVKI